MKWEKELSVARRVAQQAGDILNQKFGRENVVHKKGAIDLVTEADLQSEQVIVDGIRRYFPEDSIITEEAGERGHGQERVWIIDPLDGTTNFVHSFAVFAVSVALQVDGETVLGIVLNPVSHEHFEATKDQGAFLNNGPIRVSRTSRLLDALLATGFPYDIHRDPDRVMALFTKMITRAQGVRRPGSAAIDLCYVAAGRFDGFWEEGLKPWDTAAGAIIVDEAGGRLSTFEGDAYSPRLPSLVASNSLIHEAMLEVIKS